MSVRAVQAATRARNVGVLTPVLAVLLAAAAASPASAASAIGHVSVTILPAATVTETAPLTFGGTALAAPGRATGIVSLSGPPHAAVTLSIGAGDGLARPGTAISLRSLAHNVGASPSFDATGVLTVAVGATLAVGSSQPAGTYHGTYTVVVNF